VRQLAAALVVYAFSVSGFSFPNTRLSAGNWEPETGNPKAAASCRTPKAPYGRWSESRLKNQKTKSDTDSDTEPEFF
jgi:hypothetical protein